MLYRLNLYFLVCLAPVFLHGQNRIGTGQVKELYTSLCSSCHGVDLKGGLGKSLLDPSVWQVVGKTTTFAEFVKKGNLQMGMPAFEGALDDSQVRSLEIFLLEEQQKAEREGAVIVAETGGVYTAGGYSFELEPVVTDLKTPWSVAFLPTGQILITERGGRLRLAQDGALGHPIAGIPEVWSKGQGGLLEVALHPDYEENGWIYLSYSSSSGELNEKEVAMTKVVRGRIKGNDWVDQQVIFETPLKFQRSSGAHFGSRFVFKDGYLFFGIGDRGSMNMAQDITRPNGKIHRVFDDGRIPEDNPFVDEPDAYPTIWTYGNRNPQGLDMHPLTGDIWESEHGPRGGDEINVISKANNYGWPVISYGMNYNGKPITALTEAPGMEQPKHYWTPSIAVCGIDFYEGSIFPEWKYNLFVGGMASNELHRLVIEGDVVVKDEIILSDVGRVRDVASGPDGYLYLVLNGPDQVVRLVPAEPKK